MSELNEVALAAEGIERTFHQGDTDLSILRGAGFTLNRGEIVALVAPSGAGKSTLLQIAGLLERPDAGEIVVAGEACGRLGDDARTQIRRRRIGFVYQFHHLLPEFSALENVLLPQMIAGQAGGEAKARSAKLLELVGLGARLEHRPGQLSGGEQQRVAIARALANRPLVLLADEPTGNLDPETAERVFGLMVDVVRRGGLAALVATHNPNLAHRMDRVLTIEAGRVTQLA